MTSLLKFILKRKKKREEKVLTSAEIGLWLKVVARVLKQVHLLDFNGNVYTCLKKAVVMGGCIRKQFWAQKRQVCKQDLREDMSSWDDLS